MPATSEEDKEVMHALGWDAQDAREPSFMENALESLPFSDSLRTVNHRYIHIAILLVFLALLYLLPILMLPLTIIALVLGGLWAYGTYRAGGMQELYKATQPLYDEFDRTYDLTRRYQEWRWLQAYRAEREHRDAIARAVPPLAQEEWNLLVSAVGGCEIKGCNETGDPIVHRITPRTRGGTNSLNNLIVLCGKHSEEVRDGMIRKEQLREIARNKSKRFRYPIWSKWKW